MAPKRKPALRARAVSLHEITPQCASAWPDPQDCDLLPFELDALRAWGAPAFYLAALEPRFAPMFGEELGHPCMGGAA